MGLLSVSLLLDVGTLSACILAVVYVYFKWSFTYWKKRNVPYVEPIFPFGNIRDVILTRKTVGKVLVDIYKKLETNKYGGMYTFTSPRFIIREPDFIKDLLVKDFSTFHDRGVYMNEEVEPLSAHLFSLTGMKWRNLRVKLTPTFTSGKMKLMFPRLVECGKELQTCLEKVGEKGGVIEIKDILARFSTDIISSCAFGIECNCLKNKDAEFRQWGIRIFEPSLKRILIVIASGVAPVLLDLLKISTLDSDVSKYFRSMVQETVEYRQRNNVKRNDFLQLLIQLKNKGSLDDELKSEDDNDGTNKNAETTEGISMNCLAAQAFVFFIAGFETSSTTMTFCLYELAVNPDIQEILRNEIDTTLGKHNDIISYEAIQEMMHLDKVVAGTKVIIPVEALHHDPKYYPDPERFDPERFSEDEKQKRHHYVYLPFGEGPRICIGMRFGLMQTKVGLVSLLSKYQISVSEKTPIPLVIDTKSFIQSPLGGMWLKITNRSIH